MLEPEIRRTQSGHRKVLCVNPFLVFGLSLVTTVTPLPVGATPRCALKTQMWCVLVVLRVQDGGESNTACSFVPDIKVNCKGVHFTAGVLFTAQQRDSSGNNS